MNLRNRLSIGPHGQEGKGETGTTSGLLFVFWWLCVCICVFGWKERARKERLSEKEEDWGGVVGGYKQTKLQDNQCMQMSDPWSTRENWFLCCLFVCLFIDVGPFWLLSPSFFIQTLCAWLVVNKLKGFVSPWRIPIATNARQVCVCATHTCMLRTRIRRHLFGEADLPSGNVFLYI